MIQRLWWTVLNVELMVCSGTLVGHRGCICTYTSDLRDGTEAASRLSSDARADPRTLRNPELQQHVVQRHSEHTMQLVLEKGQVSLPSFRAGHFVVQAQTKS